MRTGKILRRVTRILNGDSEGDSEEESKDEFEEEPEEFEDGVDKAFEGQAL